MLELLVFLLFLLLLFLLIQNSKLRGEMESKARKLYEEWREKDFKELSRRYSEELERIKRNYAEEFEKMKINYAELAEKTAKNLFETWKKKEEDKIRKDAVEKSTAVIKGKVTEHLVPFFPDFRYNPKDARFIGSPVDLVIFHGLSEGKLEKIIFAEVKTGKSVLNQRERMVKECIENKKVSYEVITVAQNSVQKQIAKVSQKP